MAEENEERKQVIDSKSENKVKRDEKEIETKEMKPWEQHAGVISIPRFDYGAPSGLLLHSRSGFLITCTIKREKSATKEAITILEKYIGSCNRERSESLEISDDNKSTKRRKICIDEIGGDSTKSVESKIVIEDTDSCLFLIKKDTTDKRGAALSLVKLTRSGLVLLTFSAENSSDTVHIVSNIFHHLESGSLKSPLWCHRICPIQATCCLNERELREVVSKLALKFMNDKQNKLAHPVKFAVGYNRRGIEEAKTVIAKDILGHFDPSLLDRSKCFDVVASAVKIVMPDAIVDLKFPELSVLVEMLPLSGVPNGSLVAAVSILQRNLINVKPRLCIKPMISEANSRNRKM